MNGHSVHVRCSRARSTGQIQNENCFRNSFSLFVAQRRLTPLVVSSIHVSRRLMPLLSPSFQPWQLLNCITYSPGIRINVWRESLKGKRKKYSPPLEFRFFFFYFQTFSLNFSERVHARNKEDSVQFQGGRCTYAHRLQKGRENLRKNLCSMNGTKQIELEETRVSSISRIFNIFFKSM